jgi:hypothetical protein
MATAIGAYATLSPVKRRLNIGQTAPDTTQDAILQSFCDQVNGQLEAKTGRVFAPIPVIATTISSGGGAGSQSVTLASGTNIAIGDALLFGLVSATHEHGIVSSVAGAVIGLQWPLAATYANGTAVSRVQLFDGDDALENGRMLPVATGLISATAVEVAFYTGGSFNLIPTTDWFLRPNAIDREPGWPATELWMTDIPSSNNPSPRFFRGLGNIRVGCTPGWPAIPDEIAALAEKKVVAAYRGRGAGGGGSVTIGSDGQRTIEIELTSSDWRLLNGYTAKEAELI